MDTNFHVLPLINKPVLFGSLAGVDVKYPQHCVEAETLQRPQRMMNRAKAKQVLKPVNIHPV